MPRLPKGSLCCNGSQSYVASCTCDSLLLEVLFIVPHFFPPDHCWHRSFTDSDGDSFLDGAEEQVWTSLAIVWAALASLILRANRLAALGLPVQQIITEMVFGLLFSTMLLFSYAKCFACHCGATSEITISFVLISFTCFQFDVSSVPAFLVFLILHVIRARFLIFAAQFESFTLPTSELRFACLLVNQIRFLERLAQAHEPS